MTNFLLDKEIFCDQVIRNQETMFRTAKAILHQDEDAEDAVQEAICAAYAGLELAITFGTVKSRPCSTQLMHLCSAPWYWNTRWISSIREISAVLGISEAAVKTRLSRGRSRLKQLLHEE